MKLGLIVGEICESHRHLIWERTNLVWIDPTKDMSPFQVNEFKNRISEFFLDSFTKSADVNDETFFIWTNNQEIVNSIPNPSDYWRVDNGKLFVVDINTLDDEAYQVAARNWDISEHDF